MRCMPRFARDSIAVNKARISRYRDYDFPPAPPSFMTEGKMDDYPPTPGTSHVRFVEAPNSSDMPSPPPARSRFGRADSIRVNKSRIARSRDLSPARRVHF
jgi:hypothetical protein